MSRDLKLGAFLSCLSILALAGCTSGSDVPQVACTTATVPTYAEVTLIETCVACHSSQLSGSARQNAPADLNYDTYPAAVANAEEGMSEVYHGSMPPSAYAVTDEQKQAFYAWVQCGEPQ